MIDTPSVPSLRVVRWGVLLSLLTIFFGFALGGLFGGIEDTLKGRLKSSAAAVLDTAYGGDEAKAKAVVDKSWIYLQRAHLHGGAIGVVSLAAAMVLASLRRPGARIRAALAIALGAGGLGYSVYWLIAGFLAPGMGSTGAAKESLVVLAYPSAGALLLGLLAVVVLTGRDLFTADR